MTAKIFLKLISAVFCVLVVSLVAVDFMASRIAETSYVDTVSREFVGKCRILALSDLTPEKFRSFAKAAEGRLTLVRSDGVVTNDSENEPQKMENHQLRPEIAAALQGEVGISRRPSPTMQGSQFLYIAVPVNSGALRLAVPLRNVQAKVNAIRFQMLGATTLAFLPAILISAFFARYFSARLGSIIEFAHQLAQGNFSARLSSSAPMGKEFGVLSARLNDTGEKLQEMFEQLQKEHVELERLERIRKDFVINVSHELRTPLASIQGYAETLLDGALADPHHNTRFVQIIHQNAERLTRLTADLLTLSRVELKSQRFNFASYYVNGLLDNARDSMKPMADKQAIRLVMAYASPTTEVFCDSEAMHQIVTNLVDNALKYTASGGSITIGARAGVVAPQESVEVSVADTGVGIPEEDLPRLFERFYRVDKARSRELGGTGLGLAIVKHLTRAMGGDVRVESTLEKGSSFFFTVPVHDLGLSPDEAIQPYLTAS